MNRNYKASVNGEKKKCERSLCWLIENSFTVEDEPDSIPEKMTRSITNGIDYPLTTECLLVRQIIDFCIDISPPIDVWTKSSIIDKAIYKWLDERDDSQDNIENFLKSLNSILKREPEFHYKALLLFNARFPQVSNLASLCLNENNLRFVTWEKLSEERFSENMSSIRSVYGDYCTPLLGSITTHSKQAALALAQDSFDLWRVALNLAIFTPEVTIQSLFYNSLPLSKFAGSPFIKLFDEDGVLVEEVNWPHNHNQTNEPTTDEVEKANQWIRWFSNSNPNDLTGFTLDLARLYQQALDCKTYPETYLALWQVLECLTLNEPGKETVVDKRVSTFLGIDPGFKKDILEISPHFRNKYVHSRVFQDNAKALVFFLANCAALSVSKMKSLANEMSSKRELEFYFRYKSMNNTDLERELDRLKEASQEAEIDYLLGSKVIEYFKRKRS